MSKFYTTGVASVIVFVGFVAALWSPTVSYLSTLLSSIL